MSRTSPRPRRAARALAALAALALFAPAARGVDWASFQIQEENDDFGVGEGSDEHYTQGLLLSGLRHPDATPDWARDLGLRLWGLLYPDREADVFLGYELGQHIFTPQDISRPDLVVEDRPYAGWLYGGLVLNVNEVPAGGGHRQAQQIFELQLGVVGPESGAEWAQTEFHELSGDPEPMGWDHQLPFEPGLNLFYLWQRRYGSPHLDVVPHLGAALGTLQIYANAGLTVRAGWNVSGFPLQPNRDTMAPAVDRRREKWEAWVFVGVDGRAIARNLFLDGSTFKDSHSVDREDFVHDLRGGVSARYKSFRLGYTLVRRSREFSPPPPGSDEAGRHAFGSISLTWEKSL